MLSIFTDIMPGLSLFSLILAKILPLTKKVSKVFFLFFFFCMSDHTPHLFLTYFSPELKTYKSAGLRCLEYRFSALFGKQIE